MAEPPPVADLDDVFAGSLPPGLHRPVPPVAAEDLAERAAGHGWVPVVVAVGDVADKATLLDRVAVAAGFPAHVGRNWDALQDALGDLSWLGPADGWLVVLVGWDTFSEADPDDAAVLGAVTIQAQVEWAAAGTPMVVLVA